MGLQRYACKPLAGVCVSIECDFSDYRVDLSRCMP
jgi:hypothetical protein